MEVEKNVKAILSELLANVSLVAATKARTVDEILEAVSAGVKIIGENYVQEAERKYEVIGNKVKWHFIGHMQKNKVKKVVKFIDLIETVDSVEISEEIDKRCKAINKIMPVFIEINSAREPQKSGVFPEYAEELIKELLKYENIKIEGLMTMGPMSENSEDERPYLKETKRIFDEIISKNIAGLELKFLSMGMTTSYKVAIEEGANMVRIGTKIFGERPVKNHSQEG